MPTTSSQKNNKGKQTKMTLWGPNYTFFRSEQTCFWRAQDIESSDSSEQVVEMPAHPPHLASEKQLNPRGHPSDPMQHERRDLTWSRPAPLLRRFWSLYVAKVVPSSWQHRSRTTQPWSSKALIWWKVAKGLLYHCPGSTCSDHQRGYISSPKIRAVPPRVFSCLPHLIPHSFLGVRLVSLHYYRMAALSQ